MSVAIALRNVSAVYRLGDKPVTLLDRANLELLPGRYAVVAPTAADQTAMMDLFCGRRQPIGGRLLMNGECSYPIGRLAAFALPVTGIAVVRHLAALYDLDYRETRDFVEDLLMGDREHMSKAMRHWPVDARRRFGMIAGILRPCDIYLIDGALPQSPGDETFMRRWTPLFAARCENATMLMATRQLHIARAIAQGVLYVANGQARLCDLSHLRLPEAIQLDGGDAVEQEPDSLDQEFI